MEKKLTTSILFLIFNRPDTTQRVLDEIRRAKPAKLFVAADGPRKNNEGEAERCRAVRDIINQVDWDCEVYKNYSDVNLGCKIRVSSGLDWFFENVEEGIILEDDCLPSQSFFWFCHELLKHYRNDTRVMHIDGNNFQFGIQRGNASYYFSKYNLIWGWASWRRAWKFYDVNVKSFESFEKENQIRSIFRTKHEQKYWMKIFRAAYHNKINSWDYQWVYSTMIASGISIHPNVNLVQNIGFGFHATHTTKADIKLKNNFANEIEFPLKHPRFVLINEDADKFTFKNVYCKNTLARVRSKMCVIK